MEVFSRASTLRARTEGIFDAEVSAEWTIAGRPNGGYLLALLGRAASAVTGSGSVIAASAHYLRSPQPGAVEVEGRLLRRGRFISQVHTRMSQSGRSCVEALMSLGELDPSAACRWDGGIPEFRPVPFGECIRLGPDMPDGLRASIFGQVEARLAPESAGLRSRPSGRGEVCGWLKLPGGESFDPVSLLYAVDALPPPTLNTDVNAMVATVELTAHVRARPRPGPVWIASRARLIDHLCADTVCDIWDAGGRLVAHATQLAIMPPG
jgi:acyl-coenzyme A thioesterase PaaI-like protein